MKKEGKNITLEKFLDFYSEKVTREENAQYLRQNTGHELKVNLQKPQKPYCCIQEVDTQKIMLKTQTIMSQEKQFNITESKVSLEEDPETVVSTKIMAHQTWKEITPTEL